MISVFLVLATLVPLSTPEAAAACSIPDTLSVAAAFDLAANGVLAPPYPQYPPSSSVHAIPPSLLKAVGWIESNWRQFTPQGRPLISFDYGYGIMQITSGMPGAAGAATGQIPADAQARIATDYVYNIAYGARMLAGKWAAVPRVGTGDPAVVENWYYALWAYNGWGWVNNPNNPRFTRTGTPLTNPSAFPYQERVLYLVAHPPIDAEGNPLWMPVPVNLPSRKSIGTNPGPLHGPKKSHPQPPLALSAVYRPVTLQPELPGATERVKVRITNTGTQAWPNTGTNSVNLSYHLYTAAGNPWAPATPFSSGIVAFGQGATALPANVLPGHAVNVNLSISAPHRVGSYQIAFDLELGSSTWFSQAGSLPRVEPLSVVQSINPGTPPRPPASPARYRSPGKGLLFIADTSVRDGTAVGSRQRFVKGWLIYNNGRRSWTIGWGLTLQSGKAMGAPEISLAGVAACRSTNLAVPMTAPVQPGTYRSTWRAHDAKGHHFGDRLTLVVNVRGYSPKPPPPPQSTPGPTPVHGHPAPTPTPTPVG